MDRVIHPPRAVRRSLHEEKFLRIEQHVGQVRPGFRVIRLAVICRQRLDELGGGGISAAVGSRPNAAALRQQMRSAADPGGCQHPLRPQFRLLQHERIVRRQGQRWAGTLETVRRPIVVNGVG